MREGWVYKKLGEICVIERGGSPRPIEQYITNDENGLNWIKIGDAIEGSKYINSTKEKIKPEGLKKTRFVNKGDFILSNSMSFGKPYILGINGCIHDGWLVIKDKNETFNKSFLYYLLGSPNMYQEFKRLAVGGVVNNLNSQLVRNVVVPVPPIAEQERIVSELDLLSGIIEKKKAQLNEYDKLAQSIFYDMFGEEQAIKCNWKKCRVGEIYKFQYGKGNNIPEDKGDYPCYGSNGIVGHHIIFNSEDAPIIGHIGAYAGIVNWGEGKHYVTYNGVICKLIDNNNNPVYGYYMLKSQDYLTMAKRGGAQPFVSYDLLEEPTTYIPPHDLQNVFAEKIESIEKQKALVQQSISETQTLFDSTMDKYFG